MFSSSYKERKRKRSESSEALPLKCNASQQRATRRQVEKKGEKGGAGLRTMIAISHPHCTRLSHISGDSVSVRGLGASVGASGRRNHAATTLVPRAKAKDTKDAKDTEEEKTVVKIPKAPARSVRSQSLQPLHKRVGWTGEREEIRKNGSPLNSNTTQGAHGMNYHHAVSAQTGF